MAGLLIVDDEAESRQEIRTIIEESQYNYLSVYECGSGERGMLQLKQVQPYIVILDLSLPDMDGMELGKKALQLNPHVSVIVVTYLKMFELVQEAMNAGFSKYLLKPLSKADLLHSLDLVLLPVLKKETKYLGTAGAPAKTDDVDLGNPIQSVISYVHSNFYEPVTLNEMADRVYLSASHFSRLFKAEMGVTFIEYLTKYRLEQSKRLIKLTSLPIEVIANNAGFSNAGYFATTFKRMEGITPTEYRSIFAEFMHK